MATATTTDAAKVQFEDQGYVIFEHAFTVEEMNESTDVVDRLDAEREAELQQLGKMGISIPNQISFNTLLNQKNEYIRSFARKDIFVNLCTGLLGPNIKLYWDQSVYKRPEAKRDFPWHQDTGYSPTIPEVYLTFWIALEGCDHRERLRMDHSRIAQARIGRA